MILMIATLRARGRTLLQVEVAVGLRVEMVEVRFLPRSDWLRIHT